MAVRPAAPALGGCAVRCGRSLRLRGRVLRDLDVDMVLDVTPQPFDVTITSAVLEAMMMAVSSSGGRLTDDDLLDMIVAAELEPRVLWPNGYRRRSRFAFVIHPLSQQFFATVQNKMHWAITGQTAAEIIHTRADAAKPNMGLTNWRGAKVRKEDGFSGLRSAPHPRATTAFCLPVKRFEILSGARLTWFGASQ